MPTCKLRAHHGLCICYFHGMGYDEAFTAHMEKTVQNLERQNPLLELTDRADTLCSCCPFNHGGVCESSQKVSRYDAGVLAACGLHAGQTLHWQELRQLVHTCIIDKDLQLEICCGCNWQCHKNKPVR